MNKLSRVIIFISAFAIPIYSYAQKKVQNVHSGQHQMPHLIKQGEATQLIVDDKPFLILGGELGNSSFTSVEYMEPIWPKLSNPSLNVGILKVDEGRFENRKEWKVIRHLNGDQTHQGRHVRIFLDSYSILRFELYNYD